jgi:signal transduction histidine kinase
MKIQTQSWFLVSGIVLVPLLMILSYAVFQQLFVRSDTYVLPEYEEISSLLNKKTSARDWESVRYVTRRFQNLGKTAVFRDDYYVLYSTLPEFTTGLPSAREEVRAFLDTFNQMEDYTFVTLNMKETRVFILNRAIRPPNIFRSVLPLPAVSVPDQLYFSGHPPPFFIPSILIITFIALLIVFAICMSIIITRSITGSVKVLEDTTRRIAEGELDLNVVVKGSNEIISLTNSLNKMRKALMEKELRRSRLIMGISHDLKTPLALIKGYAEAIEDGVVEDTVSRSDAAKIIIEKAGQLEDMIQELVKFVRMGSGEWRGQLHKINITGFLKKFTAAIKKDIEVFNHEFISEISLPENLPVLMDEKLTQRALQNIINNAVRYTPKGSVISLAAVLAGNAVELTINDNGPGIDKEDLPHIFEMFYRGTSSRREQGMGLGLSMVKWVVEYHNWSIFASSEKDHGACFTITIPR